MKRITVVLCSLLLLNCSNDGSDEQSASPSQSSADTALVESKNSQSGQEFRNYLNSLDQLNLPLSTGTSDDLLEPQGGYDQDGFAKYKSERASYPYGIVFHTDSAIGILEVIVGDLLVPYFTIYNSEGEIIESLFFYDNAGQDPWYEGRVFITFNTDRSIEVRDTVERWEEDENGFPLEDSKVTTTTLIVYAISESGIVSKSIVENSKRLENEPEIDRARLDEILSKLVQLNDRHLTLCMNLALFRSETYDVDIDDFRAEAKAFKESNQSVSDGPASPESFILIFNSFKKFQNDFSTMLKRREDHEAAYHSEALINLLNALESSHNRISAVLQEYNNLIGSSDSYISYPIYPF
ncbi:MAG: hypothetical protein HWE14_07040 [Flavobacteriia bacterium]|nr:hypothetical protein [Flavobacteriia bacterium]